MADSTLIIPNMWALGRLTLQWEILGVLCWVVITCLTQERDDVWGSQFLALKNLVLSIQGFIVHCGPRPQQLKNHKKAICGQRLPQLGLSYWIHFDLHFIKVVTTQRYQKFTGVTTHHNNLLWLKHTTVKDSRSLWLQTPMFDMLQRGYSWQGAATEKIK